MPKFHDISHTGGKVSILVNNSFRLWILSVNAKTFTREFLDEKVRLIQIITIRYVNINHSLGCPVFLSTLYKHFYQFGTFFRRIKIKRHVFSLYNIIYGIYRLYHICNRNFCIKIGNFYDNTLEMKLKKCCPMCLSSLIICQHIQSELNWYV